MTDGYDLAVVGAGIVGLGHAAAAVELGRRVVVIDRAGAVTGATIRNFGHIGTSMHTGHAGEYARRARELWLRLAERAGFWVRTNGTLLVARADDELAVLEESGAGQLLTAHETARRAPVRGATGGMLCPDDLQVDPREAGPALAAHLAAEGVDIRWRTAALGVEPGLVHTTRGTIRAETVVVAVGHDLDQLYPDIADDHHVRRCGLDMMLADGVGLEIPVLTGSSLLRYSAFATTPTAVAVRERIAREDPEVMARDVNQMYTERPDGTLVVGDTHYLGTVVPPFQDEAAFALLGRLATDLFGHAPTVRERWQGVYAKGDDDFLVEAPDDGVRAVAVTTGIGMTTGLALAEAVVAELEGAFA